MAARRNNLSFPVVSISGEAGDHPILWVALTEPRLDQPGVEPAESTTLRIDLGLQDTKIQEDRYALDKIRKWLRFADRILPCSYLKESGKR